MQHKYHIVRKFEKEDSIPTIIITCILAFILTALTTVMIGTAFMPYPTI